MAIGARLILPALTAAAVCGGTAAATTRAPHVGGCVAPRLAGLTERAAARTAGEAGCTVRLAGARLRQATVQTVAAQSPAAGQHAAVLTLTLNPLCFGAALAGPPHDEGMRPGPTELITGIYVVGGPALPYSTPRCRRKPGKPAPGMIEVLDPTDGAVVASRTVTRGRLVTFRLAPGRYRISGHVDSDRESDSFARPFTIRTGFTTRRYAIEPVP